MSKDNAIIIKGKPYESVAEAARRLGIDFRLVENRLARYKATRPADVNHCFRIAPHPYVYEDGLCFPNKKQATSFKRTSPE